MIERALAEDSDIFFDYSGRELEEKDGFVAYIHFEKHCMINCCFCCLSVLSLDVGPLYAAQAVPVLDSSDGLGSASPVLSPDASPA